MRLLTCTLLLASIALHAAAAKPDTLSPADRIMMSGMVHMNQAMQDAPMTGNPDQDFAAMMIPHHQGAIDMAKVELQYGTDPVLHRMAKDIIAAQTREITELQNWRAHHAGR